MHVNILATCTNILILCLVSYFVEISLLGYTLIMYTGIRTISKLLKHISFIYNRIIFVAGTLMFAFVSIELPWLIFPALTCVGVGGLPLLMTNAQVCMLKH